MSSDREVFSTSEPNNTQTLHRFKFSDNYRRLICCQGILLPCTCACCFRDEIMESSYIAINENKLEINQPSVICCGIWDHVTTIYYDRDIMDVASVAKCCSPSCTHCSCFPTCCDICGEGIVLHSAQSHCCNYKAKGDMVQASCGFCICCPKNFHMIVGVDNADHLCKLINTAVANRRAGQVVNTQPKNVPQMGSPKKVHASK